MAYQIIRIPITSSPAGTGKDIGDVVNEWLAINVDKTIVDITVNWVEGRRRNSSAIINLVYSDCAGARQWAIRLVGTPTSTIADQTAAFFAGNPGFMPVKSVDIRSPSTVDEGDVLLIYMASRDLIRTARPGLYANYAPCGGVVPAGVFGFFMNVDDASAPFVIAQNLGNGNWLEGRPGILVRNVDGCPDDDCRGCTLGGIAPDCGQDGANACSFLSFFQDCSCLDDVLSEGGSTPPVGSTTSTTTTTTTSTTTNTYPAFTSPTTAPGSAPSTEPEPTTSDPSPISVVGNTLGWRRSPSSYAVYAVASLINVQQIDVNSMTVADAGSGEARWVIVNVDTLSVVDSGDGGGGTYNVPAPEQGDTHVIYCGQNAPDGEIYNTSKVLTGSIDISTTDTSSFIWNSVVSLSKPTIDINKVTLSDDVFNVTFPASGLSGSDSITFTKSADFDDYLRGYAHDMGFRPDDPQPTTISGSVGPLGGDSYDWEATVDNSGITMSFTNGIFDNDRDLRVDDIELIDWWQREPSGYPLVMFSSGYKIPPPGTPANYKNSFILGFDSYNISFGAHA